MEKNQKEERKRKLCSGIGSYQLLITNSPQLLRFFIRHWKSLPFPSALFATTSRIAHIFAFHSSLLHTDMGKQTMGKRFCSEELRRGGRMENEARWHRTKSPKPRRTPASLSGPGVWQTFVCTAERSLSTVAAAEGVCPPRPALIH